MTTFKSTENKTKTFHVLSAPFHLQQHLLFFLTIAKSFRASGRADSLADHLHTSSDSPSHIVEFYHKAKDIEPQMTYSSKLRILCAEDTNHDTYNLKLQTRNLGNSLTAKEIRNYLQYVICLHKRKITHFTQSATVV
jgi:hypothetical protein